MAAAAILGGANVMTQVLKRLTLDARAYDVATWSGGIGEELWPSGHTTAAMTLVLCLVLVSPQRLRPIAAALGALFAVAVVYSILLLGWHLPSDVIGGFLVASGWTLVAVAVLQATERRWPSPERHERSPRPGAVVRPALVVAGLSALAVVAVGLSRPDSTIAHAVEHSTFVLGAPLIGAAALALSTAVALSPRR